MISFKEAVERAAEFVVSKQALIGVELQLIPEPIADTSFAWVFSYNSAKHLLSGNIVHALVGNGPILVDKSSGFVTEVGTAHELNFYLDEYRLKRGN